MRIKGFDETYGTEKKLRRKRHVKETGSGTFIGGSSILVILAVLCMTVFALLSIATVKSDMKLTDRQVEAIEDYYKADCVIEEIISELRQGTVRDSVSKDGDVYSFGVVVSENRYITVEVKVNGDDYEIIRRHSVTDSVNY